MERQQVWMESGSALAQPCDAAFDILDMLQGTTALIGVYDQTETLRFTNEAFRKAYFIDPDETVDWQTLMRRNFEACRGTIIQTDDIDGWISSVRSRRGKSRLRTYESDLHDGRFIWVTETRREDGWIIYVGSDVTPLNASERELRLARDELARMSFTDELTGVSNRRHVLGKLQEVIDSGRTGWACVLDIDFFKHINDTFGHQAGDDVLVSLAQTVRKTIDLQDCFGRLGGEEFLIVFPNKPFEAVQAAVCHLKRTVSALVPVPDQPDLRITSSAGLSAVTPGDTVEQILRRADMALYHAKRNGRNQTQFAQQEAGDYRFTLVCNGPVPGQIPGETPPPM